MIDMSILQAPSQLRFQRLFSTAARIRRSVEGSRKQSFVTANQSAAKSAKQNQSSEEQSSVKIGQSSISSRSEDIQRNTIKSTTASPTASIGKADDGYNSESFNEVCQLISQLEGELGFLRNQVQTLALQHNDDSKSASIMNDQIKQYKEMIDSADLENKDITSKPHVRKVPGQFSDKQFSGDFEAGLPHLDHSSAVHMVSVAKKRVTNRKAVAVGSISLNDQAFNAITSHLLEKGDVLSVARIAAIQAVKKTSDIIPLCHPGLPIEGISVDITLLQARRVLPDSEHKVINMETTKRNRWMKTAYPRVSCLKMSVVVESSGKTGIEMEALTGVTAGLLTVYDMCKSINREAKMSTQLLYKSGGQNGNWTRRGISAEATPLSRGDSRLK